jgi:lipopolysaccharide export system permease protein
MKFYRRYITTNFLTTFLFNIVTISSIIAISQSLRLLNLFSNYNINIKDFFYIFFLLYPAIIFFLIPISVYISCVQVFYNLYKNSELTVLFSAGISKLKLAKATLLAVIFIMISHYILTFYYLPKANHAFREELTFSKTTKFTVNFKNTFSTPLPGVSIYSESNDKTSYKNIFIEDTRLKQKIITYTASSAKISTDARKLILLQGKRQDIDKINLKTNTLIFDELEIMLVNFFLNENLQKNKDKAISEMNIQELLSSSKQSSDNNNKARMMSEANLRILWPLLTPLLFLLGANAILKGEYSRVGKKMNIIIYSLKVLTSIVIVFLLSQFIFVSKFIFVLQYIIIGLGTAFYLKELKKNF